LPLLAAPRVITSATATPRELYGAQRLRAIVARLPGNERILVAQRTDRLFSHLDRQIPQFWPGAEEAYILRRIGNTIVVAGVDPSGTLYGALELASRIHAEGKLPDHLDFEDHPALKLRGVAIGMQKPEITYDGAEYDYPYTPQNFPFFYDKAWWTHYLDLLVSERYNTLYLWNGHPFTSLLRLPKYPEAQELPTAQLAQNIALFHWLTAEADKRGIWIIQGFYNIHLSHTFARAHHLPYHLSTPTPLSSAYTRYCISEFIRNYPHVGLFMTLGEALGPHYGAEWLSQTIIPGVKDGIAQLEKQEGRPVPEPPIIVRAHATDIQSAMAAAAPLYSDIDTMWKWNGESLTWTNIRGPVLERFRDLVAGSKITIANIHLLSNLEPFRWGDPDFIRETILHFERIGIQGLHLYPLRYWDWPYSADKTDPLLQQTDRDWIWYEAWARYAWNPHRDPAKERAYWAARFAERFTAAASDPRAPLTDPLLLPPDDADSGPNSGPALSAAEIQTGEHLLNAYELSGVCAPTLLPRVGITEGNREVFSLGLTMPQLIDAKRFNPAGTLWTGDAPDGERLDEYVANEVHHQPQRGETPIGVADAMVASSAKAIEEAVAASPGVTRDQAEYERIVNDMRAIHALMLFYQAKTKAAEQVMLFGYDRDFTHLDSAEALLAQSVEDFRGLVDLTHDTYRDAAAMHTSQRRIPVRGGPSTERFSDLLPVYEHELAVFRQRLQQLRSGRTQEDAAPKQLPQVAFTLTPGAGETFTVAAGQTIFAGKPEPAIATVDPEIAGLTGIRVTQQLNAPLDFTLSQPAQVLVAFLRPPGSNATNVSAATEQWNLALPDALTLSAGARSVSVWAKPLPAGRNELDLGKGDSVILGFVPEATTIIPTIGSAPANGQTPNLDWLFED
ncbi:MAG: hypothetical protein WBD46_11685, partial [Acidobacteriaceae bacterium]